MLSVVIPTLNAEAHIADCLERMKEADERVVVDGGSKDATVSIAQGLGAHVVRAPPGRGSQLRAGGEIARGDWLLFLHADTRLDPDWFRLVVGHMVSGRRKSAFFRLRLDDSAWQARAVERAVAARVALFGLPYGDQGLLVPRRLYEEIGGYRPIPLMEDVDIVRRIGRRRLEPLDVDAWTSAERWRRDGWLRRSALNLFCLGLYTIGVPPERIARFYA
jgi:rSAM/selenodomain-associated transferase 2